MGVDLGLNTGVRFNWVTSIFYIVYMFVEVPSNIILKKIGPKYYLPLLVVAFGFVSMCTAFVKSFKTLLVARAFLGVFEGGVMPSVYSSHLTILMLTIYEQWSGLFHHMLL
jgi:adenylosuccinate synthase